MDARNGGGYARSSLVEWLNKEVATLLNGQYTGNVGKALSRAAAQATMLAAWMSYDAGIHGLGQRYFIQALKLADDSGDRLYSATILDAMSHQATFLGRFNEAANLARAARTGTTAIKSPTLTAHFYSMEARALARLGDTSGCDRAMSAAVSEFERRVPSEDPDWFTYFNDAEFAAELGHCNRDLNRPVRASSYASQSAGINGDQVRSDFFATMVLADSYLDQGEAEEACRHALIALRIGEQLQSARCAKYVDEFRERLAKLGKSPIAREFIEQAKDIDLWAPTNV
jgi:tetratricopeptide (TPR) repeat protein